MVIPHSIRQWLRDIHADLEGYVADFEELGYNPQFLMETETRWFKADVEFVAFNSLDHQIMPVFFSQLWLQNPGE